ncbi:MAG: hypothetical protein Q9161_003576 [Pseudevernia consocians]
MHTLCALFTLFLQSLLTVPTTVLSLSDARNESFVASQDATNSSNYLTESNSLPSTISLTFDLFTSQIPSSAVNAALSGAIIRIYPFLLDRPNDPITNDNFQYRAVGGSVQIGVTGVPRRRLSWRQLNSVLRQVASFMNGDIGTSRQHMQELSFEIIIDGTKVGDGLVSYHPSHGLQSANSPLANLTNSNDTRLLLAATDPSIKSLTANAIPFRIPDTPFTLVFGFLGLAIPISKVSVAFDGAYLDIISPLAQHPASPIPGNRFEYEKDGVRFIVLANEGNIMTWKQLSWVLGGMYTFMDGTPEHYQVLACHIVFVGHGNVGVASVGYNPPGLEVTKRAPLNTTVSLPLAPTPFPIPDTPMIINFTYLGRSMPWRDLEDAIRAALDQIDPSYTGHGTDPVPGNHFFRALKGVRITIFASVPHIMSWIELYNIVWGLLLFVTGADRGWEQHRALTFDVDDVRTGKLAYGTLRYSAPKTVDTQEIK